MVGISHFRLIFFIFVLSRVIVYYVVSILFRFLIKPYNIAVLLVPSILNNSYSLYELIRLVY